MFWYAKREECIAALTCRYVEIHGYRDNICKSHTFYDFFRPHLFSIQNRIPRLRIVTLATAAKGHGSCTHDLLHQIALGLQSLHRLRGPLICKKYVCFTLELLKIIADLWLSWYSPGIPYFDRSHCQIFMLVVLL